LDGGTNPSCRLAAKTLDSKSNATLSEIDNNPAEIGRLLAAKEIDAFGANCQRLAPIERIQLP
jgi:hypothetical protein